LAKEVPEGGVQNSSRTAKNLKISELSEIARAQKSIKITSCFLTWLVPCPNLKERITDPAMISKTPMIWE
jgi:hypothetical protein